MLQVMVGNIFTPAVIGRHKMLVKNVDNYEGISYYASYEGQINKLINDLSKLVTSPNEMVRRFNDAPIYVQLGLYARYELVLDSLDDKRLEVLTVPADLPSIFKWCFTTLVKC